MLPKAWAQMETKAKLETHEARDPAEAATKKHIGMNKLVDYNWRMSVGDVELTEEEMEDWSIQVRPHSAARQVGHGR